MVKKLIIKERNRRISEGLRLAWKRRKAGKMAEPATEADLEKLRRTMADFWHPFARRQVEPVLVRLAIEIAARQEAERRVIELTRDLEEVQGIG